MNLHHVDFPFVLLTPAMIGGAQGKGGNAEMRIASIRGQIRWWHRKAGLSPFCNDVWGQTNGQVIASGVSLTLLPSLTLNHADAPILPHKQSAVRDAISPAQSFTLRLTRLVGCSGGQWKTAQDAMKLWLLLGGLGLRVNRAAGSVWPIGTWVPADEKTLRSLVSSLGYSHPIQLADVSILSHLSLNHESSAALKLRCAASNTVKGSPHLFGDINPRRRPSPLKIKVIRFGTQHRLLLTGLDSTNMTAARAALGSGKPLGSVAWS